MTHWDCECHPYPQKSRRRRAENDRTPNRGGESYVKTFKPMTLGKVRLEKGRGELALRATDIPGSQVMEVRLLLLNR